MTPELAEASMATVNCVTRKESQMSFIRKHSAAAAMAAGAAFTGAGVVNAVHHNTNGEDVVGLAGHLSLGFFAVGLILVAAGYVGLGTRARSTKGATAAAIGTALLGVTCVTSVVNSHDLSFFIVVAPITNALWLFGSIALAVSLKREGRVPRAVYLGLPVAWIGCIPLGSIGGALLAGAYWLAVGYLLADEQVEDSVAPSTEAA
jgi:hypothetical protein